MREVGRSVAAVLGAVLLLATATAGTFIFLGAERRQVSATSVQIDSGTIATK